MGGDEVVGDGNELMAWRLFVSRLSPPPKRSLISRIFKLNLIAIIDPNREENK